MDDEELLRRLAPIEGHEVEDGCIWLGETLFKLGDEWNPLTNDAQAMALVKKYRFVIDPLDNEPHDDPEDWWDVWYGGTDRDPLFTTDRSLNRAICLAVVATKGDEHGR